MTKRLYAVTAAFLVLAPLAYAAMTQAAHIVG